MTDFPEDVMEAAEKTLDLMCCNCKEAGDVRAESILDIARAILSERLAAEKRGEQRERGHLAKIIRDYGCAVGKLDRHAGRTAQFIREAIEADAAIRNGDPR